MSQRPVDELCDLSAVEARRLMGEGSLSSAELVAAHLARIAEVDPYVNAMVTVAGERAMAEAREADNQALGQRSDGLSLGPLHGLPVAIKDLQATAGIRTTFGSETFADHVPSADAAIVAKIREAGGIVVAKTNIPERSIGANTVNRLVGATGNPFDPVRTAGGSSGGSAAAVAAGMVPLATGSDHGGSLRIPACYCGVVGYRATPGVVPFEERTTAQTFYAVQGPIARTVDDAALLLSVIARRGLGNGDLEPARSVPGRSADPLAFPLDADSLAVVPDIDLSQLRVGYSEDLGGVLVSEDVRRTFRRRIEQLAGSVAVCEPVALDLTDAAEVDWRLRADVFVTQYHREAESWDPGFNPNIRSGYEAATETSMVEIAKARGRQMELIRHTQAVLDNYDVVLCPGVSVAPFPWTDLYPTAIDGRPVDNYMAWLTLTAAFTVVGHPVVALPAGLDDDGMPFGVQVVGSAYDDAHLLAVARALESCFSRDTLSARPVMDTEALMSSAVDLLDVSAVFDRSP